MIKQIEKEVSKVQLLAIFTQFCDTHRSEESKRRIYRILRNAQNKKQSLKNIFLLEQAIKLNEVQAELMLKLVTAYLNKSDTRRKVTYEQKKRVLKRQNYICPICKGTVDITAHLDHIVPYKYVGDQLGEDNFQMLCKSCNLHKSAKIDYQLLELLKTGGTN